MNDRDFEVDGEMELDGADTPEAPEAEGNGRVAALEQELADARQAVLYAQAETQNVRRRMEKDATDARQYAATAFARDMLSVKDNLERALAAATDELRADERFAALIAGIEATGRELDGVFSRHGIARVDSMGQPLDPNKHQAMMEVPTADAAPGTVVQEMQAGYVIKDRLLRPALVAVAKAG